MLDSIGPQKDWERIRHQSVWEKPKSRFRIGFAVLTLLLLVAGIFAGIKAVTFAERILDGPDNHLSFLDFFMGADKKLQGEDQGTVRVLLLGIGGAGHDGGTLTDTIILATIVLGDEPQVSLVSIPRDLVVEIAETKEFRKINSAYALGELNQSRRGAAMAVATAEKLLDLKIPYYGVVDFQGFEKIIDDLGGVNITVDQSFTDSYYPDEREGYLPTVAFEKGEEHMDGRRALQFVRSRHGTNSEGSDFARSRRQQKVLRAVKDKAATLKVATNLGLVSRLMDDLSNHLRTNMQPFELKRLYDLSRDIKSENIRSVALDNSNGLICDHIDELTAAYQLIPCQGLGQYDALRAFVKNQNASQSEQPEGATVEIQNSTKIDFLGQKIKQQLLSPNLTVNTANFRGTAEFSESMIYDNTGGKKPKTLKFLQSTLGISAARSPFPFSSTTDKPDFVIIVATDLNK